MDLTLVIPDLIPERPAGALVDVYRDLHVPDLAFLLARARRQSMSGASLEAWLCARFGLETAGDLPVAALTLLAEHGQPGDAWWLRADPVHLEAGHDRLVLTGPEALDIDRVEAEALVAALNTHFAGGTFSFHHIEPDHWYLRLPAPLEVRTHALPETMGRSIAGRLPEGPDAPRLARLMNEAQMLLHAHPVNQAREARGQPAINSLWLWGGGRLPAVTGRPCARLWADDLLAKGLALASDTPWSELPPGGTGLLQTQAEGPQLVVLDRLRRPTAHGDADAWRHALRVLEERWFKPLAHAFRRGRIAALTILALAPRHGMRFELGPSARWKFWRRLRPLGDYAGPG